MQNTPWSRPFITDVNLTVGVDERKCIKCILLNEMEWIFKNQNDVLCSTPVHEVIFNIRIL